MCLWGAQNLVNCHERYWLCLWCILKLKTYLILIRNPHTNSFYVKKRVEELKNINTNDRIGGGLIMIPCVHLAESCTQMAIPGGTYVLAIECYLFIMLFWMHHSMDPTADFHFAYGSSGSNLWLCPTLVNWLWNNLSTIITSSKMFIVDERF